MGENCIINMRNILFLKDELTMNRKTARENAFLLLFEGVSRGDACHEEIFALATGERELAYDAYVKDVFFGVYEHLTEIDGVVDECLVGWKKNRVSIAAMAVLRLATYEMMYLPDVPVKVSINEGIELSKRYDDEKSYIFVNGVLNAIAEKTGRKNA